MKALIRSSTLAILRFLARHKLSRMPVQIVGITGSKGKTSGKEAIAAVLGRRYKIKKSEKDMNTEFGLALTILDQTSGYSSFGKWVHVLLASVVSALRKPEELDMLVMEMGVDKPKDMEKILKIITPNVMVFLNVKDEHMNEGQFANRQAIFDDKSKACVAVPKDGWVVLNGDDNFVAQLIDKLPASSVVIGTGENADLCAKNVKTTQKGLQFTLCYEDKKHEVFLPNVMGDCHVGFVLAAIAVGFIYQVPWKAIAHGLEEYQLPPGRMNKIEGKNGSLLIDSSYNASPASVEEALKVLALFPGRKIAALGTMNELGELSESAHLKIGKLVASKANMLIAVGKYAKTLAEGGQRAGLSAGMIHVFRTSKEAGEFMSGMLEKHDVVLVKGSQNNVRMEHLVKACMQEPEQARSLLVRQEPYWLTHM